MHVVFYETRISSQELIEIMKHTAGKGFATKGVHPLCDPAPYKLGSRQCFRHVLSDKIGVGPRKRNAGNILKGLPPSTQIIQTKGIEPLITKAKWSKHFVLSEKQEFNKTIKEIHNNIHEEAANFLATTGPIVCEAKNNSEDLSGVANLTYSQKLIILNEEELAKLLNEFPPDYKYFSDVMSNLWHSPYEEDFIQKILEDWYNREGEHLNGFPVNFHKYYEKTENNKWFYSIVKYLPDSKKIEWLDKFKYQSVDETAEINLKENFSLKDLRTNNYKRADGAGINVNKFISDMKRCIAFINSSKPLFVVKEYSAVDKCNVLGFIREDDFKKLMKSINLGKIQKDGRIKEVNGWMIFNEGKNKNWLMKDGMKFYSENPNIISYFGGYNQNLLDSVNMTKIQPFLNHTKEVISNNDEVFYEYLLNCFAFILQNPGEKTGTTIVLTGEQGTGKNVFTNVLCKILSPYSNENVKNRPYCR